MLHCIDKSNSKVDFSVRNVWESIRVESNNVPWAKLVWSNYCIPKYVFLLWLVFGKKLETQDRTKRWDGNLKFTSGCLYCNQVIETHNHLFFECLYSKMVWSYFHRVLRMRDISEKWDDICNRMLTHSKRKKVWSIVTNVGDWCLSLLYLAGKE